MANDRARSQDDWAEHQIALACFGEKALRAESLDEILTEACRLVGTGLGTDCAKVLERQPDGRVLVVRAGYGWKDDVVGRVIVPAEEDTAAHHALTHQEPVVSPDLDREKRFKVAGFLHEHGIKALANVVIANVDGEPPYGVLEVDSRSPRKFSDSDMAFLRSYGNLLSVAVQRMRFLDAIRAGMVTKDRLLRELQHRIRNNLQVVIGLVRLRQGRTHSEAARQEFDALLQNLEPLRIVHEKLDWMEEIDRIDLGHYLGELCTGLLRFHGERAENIRLKTEIDHVTVSSEIALPLGLIANEFVTNSLKYAFADGRGTVGVEIVKAGEEGRARIRLWDSGNGFDPKGLGAMQSKGGTGLLLIDGLISQIGAEADWETASGTALTLTISLPETR